jgi:hypothetical protein
MFDGDRDAAVEIALPPTSGAISAMAGVVPPVRPQRGVRSSLRRAAHAIRHPSDARATEVSACADSSIGQGGARVSEKRAVSIGQELIAATGIRLATKCATLPHD